VKRVRAGRLFHVQITAESAEDARSQATRMAEQLLANPVIEQFSVDVEPLTNQAG
jgi:phosphoribosylformylglycinamidine (FGAM) synthase PurS component